MYNCYSQFNFFYNRWTDNLTTSQNRKQTILKTVIAVIQYIGIAFLQKDSSIVYCLLFNVCVNVKNNKRLVLKTYC